MLIFKYYNKQSRLNWFQTGTGKARLGVHKKYINQLLLGIFQV